MPIGPRTGVVVRLMFAGDNVEPPDIGAEPPSCADSEAASASRHPGRCLVALAVPNPRYAADLLRDGMHGVMLYGQSVAELLEAVDTVAGGGIYLAPSIATPTLHALAVGDGRARLSRRDRQVLTGLAAGEGTRAIAARIGISPDTARNAVSGLLRRLGVNTRVEAVAVARRDGLIATVTG